MIVLLASFALAQDLVVDEATFLDSTTRGELVQLDVEPSEAAPGYSFLVSKRQASSFDTREEEVAWGEATSKLAQSIRVEFTTEVLEDLELRVTPIDENGYAIGATEVLDIQAAIGRGTRGTASTSATRTDLL